MHLKEKYHLINPLSSNFRVRGRIFKSLGTTILKARSSLVLGQVIKPSVNPARRSRRTYWWLLWCRQVLDHVVITRTVNWILYLTGSEWRAISVTWDLCGEEVKGSSVKSEMGRRPGTDAHTRTGLSLEGHWSKVSSFDFTFSLVT